MRTSDALVEKWLFHNRQIPVWLSRHRNRHLMWVFTGGITQRSPFLPKLFVCSGQLMVFWQHQTMIEVLVCLSFLAAVHISFPINFTVFKKKFFFVCFTEWRSELSARSHGCPGWHPGRRDIFAKFTCFFFTSYWIFCSWLLLCFTSVLFSVNLTSKQQVIETIFFPNGGKPPTPIVFQSCSNKARNSRHPPPSEQLQREHLCYGVPVLLFSRMSDVPSLGLRGIFSSAHFFGRSVQQIVVFLFFFSFFPILALMYQTSKHWVGKTQNKWIMLPVHLSPCTPHPEMQNTVCIPVLQA